MTKLLLRAVILVAAGLVVAACLHLSRAVAEQQPQSGHASSFSIRSSAFAPGTSIPSTYTCDGRNVSPPLSWRAAPRHTVSFALIVDDPDAPGGVYTHWVLFNLPASMHALRSTQPAGKRLSNGATQGKNDFGKIGYGGPCPPSGPAHRYRFTLYALDTKLHLSSGATKQQVLSAMRGHILGKTQLIGRYKRSG